MELCERLNEESGEPRTVPGLPFSALWLTMNPKEDNVHCDENVCGCTILFTTQSFKGSELVVMNGNKRILTRQLKRGQILYGNWANHAHCNHKVDAAEFRTSWTLYLDYRVFSKKYIYVYPKGYVESDSMEL
jgi:hypothetical protein